MPKFYDKVDVLKKPGWLKIRLHRAPPEYAEVQQIVDKHALHTICSSGMCPNKAECWSRRTATFMILGDICTRGCRFCATKTGHPLPPTPRTLTGRRKRRTDETEVCRRYFCDA